MKKQTIKEYHNLYPVTLYVGYLGDSANLNEIFNFYNYIHESIHYADAVFEYLHMNGEGYDKGNEHYAYLVTWCFEQLEDFRNAERDKKR